MEHGMVIYASFPMNGFESAGRKGLAVKKSKKEKKPLDKKTSSW